LELEEQRVWKRKQTWSLKSRKFGNTSLKVNTLFYFFFLFFVLVLVLMGAFANFQQWSAPPFSFRFVTFESKWVPSSIQAPSFSFFFLCVLLLVGANGLHH
jgi:hypothetical protein